MVPKRAVVVVLLLAAWFLAGEDAFASNYDTDRSAAIKTCEAISPSKSQSGLYFNPDGYRSYYERSECFQKAAVQFRDPALCAQVRQRRSVLASSWGYSPANCRKLVTEGIEADRKELEDLKRRYDEGAVLLRDFRIERNGNGRDFDVIPLFAGVFAHGYTLTLEIVPASGGPVVFHSSGYYVDAQSNLRVFVRQEEIRARLPAFEPGRSYRVRATLVLTLPTGGPSSVWSDAFVERAFPLKERSQSVVRDVRF